MRVLLLHNPSAGRTQPDRATLVREFERADHDVVYQSVKRKGWKNVLDEPTDLIIAAGGDGTVRRVATSLAERESMPRAPLVIVPLGTANNIARSLGARGSPAAIARRIPDGIKTRLAIGIAHAPWGDKRFVEAAGVGAFARMLRQSEAAKTTQGNPDRRRKEAEIEDGLGHLRAVVKDTEARHLRLTADDEDLSGEYILVEAMNIASIGSCVDLANADHTDDRLDLVLIRPDQREKLAGYLEQLGRCERFDPPFDSRSVRRVTLQWNPNDGHADDAPWPEHPDEGIASSIVTIEIDGSVSVLVPETD